ncbi:MAG: hypothetical protein B6U78_00325 [Candidatus Aenigmarchaeota archaeon ex4484_224]|nr:MAG: hypothetical protein B6U78_00325 [Candidatus Aenigmarchaeota archaeon ex4484_224]
MKGQVISAILVVIGIILIFILVMSFLKNVNFGDFWRNVKYGFCCYVLHCQPAFTNVWKNINPLCWSMCWGCACGEECK